MEPADDAVMVDENYWLSRAKVMIDGAITSREEAAGKLVTGVGWFWTVYSTVVITGVILADRQLPVLVAIALIAPVGLLVAAYLLGLHVMIPPDGELDLGSPEEIRLAYREVLNLKRRRLRYAVEATVLAAIAVVIAILIATLTPA